MTWQLGAAALIAAAAFGAPLATLPIEIHKGMIWADVLVNGRTLKLVIDSAAGRPVVDLAKAREIGLNIEKKALHGGPHASTPQEVRVAENVSYAIDSVRAQEDFTVVYSLEFLAKRLGRPVDGVFGGKLLREHVVELDYPKREMRIWAADTYRAPIHANAVPAEMVGRTVAVRGSIASHPGLFGIDTGAGGADVVLWNQCASEPSIAGKVRDLQEVTSTSFGGDRKNRQGRIDGLVIGAVSLQDVAVRLSDRSPDGSTSSPLCGNLGGNFFARFNTVLDVPHKRMLFVPSAFPFEVYKGMIFVDVAVNGGPPMKLLFDTDSSRSTLDVGKARELGINVEKVALTKGTHAETPQEIRVAENVRYRIGDVEIEEPITVMYSLEFLAKRLGRPIDGIIGSTLLRNHVVEVDYGRREMRIQAPDAFRAPDNARVVPAEWMGPHVGVRGAVQGIEESFYVDTGIGGSHAVLYRKCSANPAIASALRDGREMVATAFGGDRKERSGKLDKLQIGGIEVADPSVRLSEVNATVCGHIGNSFFEPFRTIFDMPHGRILLMQ